MEKIKTRRLIAISAVVLGVALFVLSNEFFFKEEIDKLVIISASTLILAMLSFILRMHMKLSDS
jgi:hypothetical protein